VPVPNTVRTLRSTVNRLGSHPEAFALLICRIPPRHRQWCTRLPHRTESTENWPCCWEESRQSTYRMLAVRCGRVRPTLSSHATVRMPSLGSRTRWAVDRLRSGRPYSGILRTQFAERDIGLHVLNSSPRLGRSVVVFSPDENGTAAPHQNGANAHVTGDSREIRQSRGRRRTVLARVGSVSGRVLIYQ
jgi:hypothetical protein